MTLPAFEFSQSSVHEFNVISETLPMFPNPIYQIIKPRQLFILFDESFKDSFFFWRKYARSHSFHQRYHHNNDIFKYYIVVTTICRVGASKGEAKNSALKKNEEGKTLGKN